MISHTPLGFLVGATFTVLAACVCVSDVRSRRIPNRLVLLIAAAGVVLSLLAEPSLAGVGRAFGGMAVGFAIWFPFYLLRMLGAGDVKFFAAASAWLGPMVAVEAALFAGMLGGVLALIWIARGGWVLALARIATAPRGGFGAITSPGSPAAGAPAEGAPSSIRDRLPYGVAMAAGLVLAAWLPGLLF